MTDSQNRSIQVMDLVSTRRLREAEVVCETARAAGDSPSRILFMRGLIEAGFGDARQAAKFLREAAAAKPDDADLKNDAAVVLRRVGRREDALRLYQDALTLPGPSSAIHVNLANLLQELGRTGEAEFHYREALESDAGQVDANYALARLLRGQGRLHEAIPHLERVIRSKPTHAGAWFVLGMTQLACGDFEQGWQSYEWRWRDPGFPGRDITGEEWTGGDIAGQTILVHAEQGIGDTIQFARYAALLRDAGAKVLFYCQSSLMPVLQNVDGISQLVPQGDDVPPFDKYVAVMSLPHRFGTRTSSIPASIPYIAAPEIMEESPAWLAEFEPDLFNIGLTWAGRPSHRDDAARSCQLLDLLPLSALKGIRLFGLQKDPRPADLSVMHKVTNLGPRLKDFGAAAQFIEKLDLILSVDTATAHLAGAMGKPVWLLLPYHGEWRWALEKDSSPWYPTMRIFRQDKNGGWSELIDRVMAELQTLIQTRRT